MKKKERQGPKRKERAPHGPGGERTYLPKRVDNKGTTNFGGVKKRMRVTAHAGKKG